MSDLTDSQLLVLRLVGELGPNQVAVAEIFERSGLTRGTLHRAIEALLTAELVDRSSEQDRNRQGRPKVLVSLTDDGLSELKQYRDDLAGSLGAIDAILDGLVEGM